MNPLHPTSPAQSVESPRVRRPAYTRRIALLVAAGCLLTVLVAAALAPQARADAASQQTAHVVVQFDDTASNVLPLTFTSPISGLRALQLAGFDVITTSTSFGVAVCSIESVGCPATNCFCSATHYWGYSRWDGAAWDSYMVGAGSSVISQTGAIEGWLWGEYGDAQVPAPVTMAASAGLEWLSSRQVITSGGYGGASGAVETMLAIGSNGLEAANWQRTSQSPSLQGAFLPVAATYSRQGAAQAGKLSVAVAAANACVPMGVVAPSAYYSPTLGAYNANAGDNSWAILGTVARGEVAPATAVTTLRSQVQANGGWEWGAGWGVDTNATALAVQALIATGETPGATVISNALAYLKSTQNTDGGFPYALGGASDSNSTAYVVQAIVAAGQKPAGVAWQSGGKSPLDFLTARQLVDGGFEWQAGKGANLLATQQAIPALLGQANPITVRAAQNCPTTWMPVVAAGQ